jgi:diacylglycerol kinase (ATP)
LATSIRIRLSFPYRLLATHGDALRVLLVHNPTAGDEEHDPETLRAALEAGGHEVTSQSTKDSEWERAFGQAVDLVVAAGGDGTVRKVFRQLPGKDVRATILPLGTANNIARSLGFEDDDPGALVRGWSNGRILSYDIGSLTSAHGEDRFVESAGAGLFADVLVRAENDESNHSDKIEKGLHLLLASLAGHPPLRYTLELDGDRFSDELIGFEVMNVSEGGPQVLLAPAADPGDGALDVVLIRPSDVPGLVTYAEARLGGHDPDPPGFQVHRAVEIVAELPADCPIHVDDELFTASGGAERDAVSALPAGRLQVLLPGS